MSIYFVIGRNVTGEKLNWTHKVQMLRHVDLAVKL